MAQGMGRRALLVMSLSALAGLATAAFAQQGPGPSRGPGMMGGGMMGGGMMGGLWTTPRYLDALKTELGISAAEEPAWKDYADTVNGVSEQLQGLHQSMFEAMGTASWEERRDLMNGMFEARRQAYDTVREAAGKLMGSLSPDQQKKAQYMLPGLAGRHGSMMGRGDWR